MLPSLERPSDGHPRLYPRVMTGDQWFGLGLGVIALLGVATGLWLGGRK